MSESTNGALRPSDDGQRTRRQQYRIVARLLKEYTARLYHIADRIGEYRDGRGASPAPKTQYRVYDEALRGSGFGPHEPRMRQAKAPWSIYRAVWRYRSIWREVQEVALYASQMLVHYELNEAESAELRIRAADAERAVFEAGIMVNLMALDDPENYGPQIPGHQLESVLDQSKTHRPF